MLNSANPGGIPSANQNQEVTTFSLAPRYDLDAYFEREAKKRALAEFACIKDNDLLEALVDADFTPMTLPALQLAPIAFVAWASESVTDEENQTAISSIFELRLYEYPMAVGRVQSWMDHRPTQDLWELWVTYTKYRLSRFSPAVRKQLGEQLLRQAKRVALASGGFIGLGKICSAEQLVLNKIRNVFCF